MTNIQNDLLANGLAGNIKPFDVSIVYENETPYLKYVGTTVLDNGIKVKITLPKIKLDIEQLSLNTDTINYRNHWGEKTASKLVDKRVKLSFETENLKDDEHYFIIETIERHVSKEILEKELGYKLILQNSK